MKKCDDKYCPECGHHLRIRHSTMEWYYCVECSEYVKKCNVATISEVTHLRAGHDARARAEQEKE